MVLVNWAWCHRPIIPNLGRLKQEEPELQKSQVAHRLSDQREGSGRNRRFNIDSTKDDNNEGANNHVITDVHVVAFLKQIH